MGLNRDKERILRHMRQNSRESLSEIGREEKLSPASLVKALKELEGEAITKYCSLIEPSLVGYGLRVDFLLQADERGFEEFVGKRGEVNTCSRLAGGWFFLECFFRDMKQLSLFKEELSKTGAREVSEHFVVEELKREGFACDI